MTMEFRTSIPKALGLMCMGIAMAAVSYFAAIHSDGYKMVLSWIGVPFFSLAVVVGCAQIFGRQPAIVMNAEGISGPRVGSTPLKWSDIAAVSVGHVRGQRFLCLWLRDQDAYVARLPTVRQLAAKGSIALGFPATSLSFSGLQPELERALEYALTYVPMKTTG